ncbi:MAG TPA: enoyl-CoA hydratase/isomerase family protein [Steroidobacteraceae bacterium]|nr:enoyl-CoA hydratase/isomerase family protein [Steroidobacteraceae bacterium]
MKTSIIVTLLSLAFSYAVGAPLDEATTKYKMIQIERHDKILVAKFSNPPRQTMNPTMVAELSDLLTYVENDEQTRVLVLTGASPNVFIASYDVGEIGRSNASATTQGEITADNSKPELHKLHQALLKIEALSKPVIAAINGRAHGGGFETALACDFRFIATNGSVGLPEVGIGIIPGGGGTQRLPRLIGYGKAKELILLGKTVDGVTAEKLGMVTRAVEPEKLMEETLAFANQLAIKPAVSLKQAKRAMREGFNLPLEDALRIEQDAYYKAARSEETRALFKSRGLVPAKNE